MSGRSRGDAPGDTPGLTVPFLSAGNVTVTQCKQFKWSALRPAACGQVMVGAENLALYVSTAYPDSSHYAFTCPGCARECCRHATRSDIVALVRVGYVARDIDLPKSPETDDPDRSTDAPPIDLNDLIDLHYQIEEWGVLDHEPTYERTIE